MYCHGLGFRIVGCFEDHDGFNGVMPVEFAEDFGSAYRFLPLAFCRRAPTTADFTT